jgi:hypothetical protein
MDAWYAASRRACSLLVAAINFSSEKSSACLSKFIYSVLG